MLFGDFLGYLPLLMVIFERGGVERMNRMRHAIYFTAHCFFLFLGYALFLISGKNTERGYQAMVYLFCHTGGRINLGLARFDGLWGKPLAGMNGDGVLGSSVEMRTKVCDQLRERGYFVKNAALTTEVCDRLMEFALKTPAIIRTMDGEKNTGVARMALIKTAAPEAVRYDYRVSDLLANPDVQDLLADPSFLVLAESYLGSAPKLDILSMWWHTSFYDQPDSEAAQLYHFDMDRPRWLKVFVYLTDVSLENGPHSFIEGSHRIDAIPERFLHRGYVRLTDDEVLDEYGSGREIVFTAPRGSIIVEDTIGLHKGGVVQEGARLVLQLQFSSSLFGAIYPKAVLPKMRTQALEKMMESNQEVYRGYL